ncbi:MAG TPA: PIN domain-containing protein [Stellaceae bacterium]|nr:PIN domain-containing protein [Stellaceae bacterium]
MLAVDTNVIVRYLTRDDVEQFAKSNALIRGEAVYVCTTVLIETEWHCAAPDRLFVHLAMSQTGEQGQGTDWAEHVSDAEYTMQLAAE